jgi:antitoxin ParD1/3/4
MARATTTMTVRISGELSEFVARNVGEDGLYENVSEYVRDLIRRDKERVEEEAFQRLKAELQQAFAAPDSAFVTVTLEEVLERNRRQRRVRSAA